jgi:RNA polymerase sigma-70 factor (ECF subfamily)
VFYDYTRRHRQTEDIDQLPERSQASSPALQMDIYAALALLKQEERTCITLQLIDGYDIRKVAEITGMKEGTVKSHLSRGKEKLANYLKKNGYDRR